MSRLQSVPRVTKLHIHIVQCHLISLLSIFVAWGEMRSSLTFYCIVLVLLANNVSCYMRLSRCTKFRDLMTPKKTTKIGNQRIQINFRQQARKVYVLKVLICLVLKCSIVFGIVSTMWYFFVFHFIHNMQFYLCGIQTFRIK